MKRLLLALCLSVAVSPTAIAQETPEEGEAPDYSNEIEARPFSPMGAVRAEVETDPMTYAGDIIQVADLDLLPSHTLSLGDGYHLDLENGVMYRLVDQPPRF